MSNRGWPNSLYNSVNQLGDNYIDVTQRCVLALCQQHNCQPADLARTRINGNEHYYHPGTMLGYQIKYNWGDSSCNVVAEPVNFKDLINE